MGAVEGVAREAAGGLRRMGAERRVKIDLDEFNRYHQVKMEEDSGTLADSLLGLG